LELDVLLDVQFKPRIPASRINHVITTVPNLFEHVAKALTVIICEFVCVIS
jgi:hypothetical protein